MLIIGLGNPGEKYSQTRHNIGFDVCYQILNDYSFSSFQKKFNSLYSEGEIANKKIRILLPQTFMNLSGNAVIEVVNFFKIDLSEIIVLHDELDIELTKLRIKTGGGNGGHNGLKSIDEKLGTNYKRMRIGIGHPGNKDMVSSYVLSKFSTTEKPIVSEIICAISKFIPLLIEGKDGLFASKFAEIANKIKLPETNEAKNEII
jgi:PTH1 family peptidyl-tRNA hydrolase